MEIIRNTCKEIQFENLRKGDVFIISDDENPYMKTSGAYEYPDEHGHYFNAVNLKDGSLTEFKDWGKSSYS